MTGSRIHPVDAGGAAALLLLTLVGWFLIMSPMRNDHAQLVAARAKLSRQNEASAQLEKQREQLETRIAEVSRRMQAESVDLKPADRLNSRLARITSLVEEAGMVIQESELGDPMMRMWYQAIPITIAGTGRYPDAAAFLRSLHDQMPDTGIVGLRLSGNPRSPGAPAQFEFDLVWFAASSTVAATDS